MPALSLASAAAVFVLLVEGFKSQTNALTLMHAEIFDRLEYALGVRGFCYCRHLSVTAKGIVQRAPAPSRVSLVAGLRPALTVPALRHASAVVPIEKSIGRSR